jgi:hypothetical protein
MHGVLLFQRKDALERRREPHSSLSVGEVLFPNWFFQNHYN